MKYYFDTEFIESPGSIQLISIGVVAEDGREYYAENSLVRWEDASDWVMENVHPNLVRDNVERSPDNIRIELRTFLTEGDTTPQLWAWYADYDWVAFCGLFGRMVDLPREWPKFCRDLKQVVNILEACGLELPPKPDAGTHNALDDARELARWSNELQVTVQRGLATAGIGPEQGLLIVQGLFES